jgi:type I restriction enzyme R subunit
MSDPPLSERDVCTKLITPAVERAGWDIQSQVREEVSLPAGRVMVRGHLVARGKAKRADYVLYLKPNLPLAVIEAKEPNHRVGDGMQQALEYAEMLGVPFAFSSNHAGFLFSDRTGQASKVETELKLDQFPKSVAPLSNGDRRRRVRLSRSPKSSPKSVPACPSTGPCPKARGQRFESS